jgi:antitoxin PrlF
MSKNERSPVAYSRVSTKCQTVIPRAVREALQIGPGDTVRYRLTKLGVVIEKAPAEADDPFAAFAEWSSASDDEAYGDL